MSTSSVERELRRRNALTADDADDVDHHHIAETPLTQTALLPWKPQKRRSGRITDDVATAAKKRRGNESSRSDVIDTKYDVIFASKTLEIDVKSHVESENDVDKEECIDLSVPVINSNEKFPSEESYKVTSTNDIVKISEVMFDEKNKDINTEDETCVSEIGLPVRMNIRASMFTSYQPWVIQTYGDLAKTKTITLRKYARIVRTLGGLERNCVENSKFRFWVRAKGFRVGRPEGYQPRPADGIVGTQTLNPDVEDLPLYVPTASIKVSHTGKAM